MITKLSWQAAIVMTILIALSLSCEVTATQLYVNGDAGNDVWDGLAPEWDGEHGPKKTIQAGIDAAIHGDTVTVADGIYTGTQNKNLDFAGKAITVRSENGPTNCTIDCQNAGRGFSFTSGEIPNSIVEGLTIKNGHADYGGGMYCYGSSPTIRDCVITSNRATDHGGGIYCEAASDPIIESCTISHNESTDDGGGVYCNDGCSLLITDCLIDSNRVTYASSAGGGLYVGSSNITVSNSIIGNNRAIVGSSDAGGIFCDNCFLDMTNCLITGNEAAGEAGGIFCVETDGIISNSIIKGNRAGVEGGGIIAGLGTLVIANCIVQDNIGCYGGGINSMVFDNSIFINCTITGNQALYGGGLISLWESAPILQNSILWNNRADFGPQAGPLTWRADLEVTPSTLTVDYCAVQDGEDGVTEDADSTVVWGAHNIDDDPLLTPDGHLQAGSPCIDVGNTADAYDPDIDGEARVSGDEVDIGADEFIDTDHDALPDWWESLYSGDAGADPDTDGLNNVQEYSQCTDYMNPDSDGDGRSDSLEAASATNPLHPDNTEKTYYVNDATGNDDYDGLASSFNGIHGPKKTIQAGINAAENGWNYTVLVADGTYTGIGNKEIEMFGKDITLKSESGSENCVIDCQGNGRAFHLRQSELNTTVIDGFTVRNGVAAHGGGINMIHSNPTIRNCHLIGNTAYENGGGIRCRRSNKPHILRCRFEANTALSGGGIQCAECDPLIEESQFVNNRAHGGGGIFYLQQKRHNRASPEGLNIIGCTVRGNELLEGPHYEGGGGVLIGSSQQETPKGKAYIRDSFIMNNTAIDYGGGIKAYTIDFDIKNCSIIGNVSLGDGGGIHCDDDCIGEVENCDIRDNTTLRRGGGIFAGSENHLSATGCTFIRNSSTSESGGGIYSYYGTNLVLTNCTFSSNTAPNGDGGALCSVGNTTELINSILWDNEADQGDEVALDWLVFPANMTISYSDVSQSPGDVYVGMSSTLTWGPGNIEEDPDFVDPGFDDYHLLWDSPCVDVGDNSAPNLPDTDLDGNPRIAFGRTSETVDMGPYEFGSYINFTNAESVSSMLKRAHPKTPSNKNVELTWCSSGLAGKTYTVYCSDDEFSDSMTWSVLESGIPTGGALTSWADTSTPSSGWRFYKVVEDDTGTVSYEMAGLMWQALITERTLVSTPFIPFNPSLDDTIGDALTGSIIKYLSDRILAWDPVSQNYLIAYYDPNEGLWKDWYTESAPPAFDLEPDKGYFIIVNNPQAGSKVCHIGKVKTESRAIELVPGRNLCGSPYPVEVSLEESGLIESGFKGHFVNYISDGIMWWNPLTQNYDRVYYNSLSSTWRNWDETAADRKFLPGEGFWMLIESADGPFTWLYPEPF